MGFIIFLGVSYFNEYKNRGEIIESQTDVPAEFARQFSRVIKKNRAQQPPSSPFIDPMGNSKDWADLNGQYTLVNFWATWCSPCVVELPSLNRLQKKYENKGLKVIAISIDTMRDHEEIKTFLDYRNIGQFAAYFDKKSNIQRNIKMRGIPTTYLLDPTGNITHIFEGDANWGSPSSYRFFDTLLTQS